MALTWSYSDPNTTLTIYSNGSDVGNTVVANRVVADSQSNTGYIGKLLNGSRFFKGFIYQFATANYVHNISDLSTGTCTKASDSY
jgi:hypothetical protein